MAAVSVGEFVELLKESNTSSVKIFVGAREEGTNPYVVPKEVLTHAAPFFEKFLKGDFKEAREGVLHFPEDDQETWAIFLNWLFKREIPRARTPRTGAFRPYYNTLMHAWSFGDKYQVPAFQNSVTRAAMDAFALTPLTPKIVQEAFDLGKKCPLPKLMAEAVAIDILNHRKYDDIDEYMGIEGFASLLMRSIGEFNYNKKMKMHPLHDYGQNEMAVQCYMEFEQPGDRGDRDDSFGDHRGASMGRFVALRAGISADQRQASVHMSGGGGSDRSLRQGVPRQTQWPLAPRQIVPRPGAPVPAPQPPSSSVQVVTAQGGRIALFRPSREEMDDPNV